MAPDMPVPEQGSPTWAARVVRASVDGNLHLLNVMAAVEEASDGQIVSDGWTREIATTIRQVRPSDAESAVESILRTVRRWQDETGYTAPYERHRGAVEAIADALIPPARRDQLRDMLETVATVVDSEPDLTNARLRIMGSALHNPLEALHTAAAFAVVLWRTPDCVPERGAAQHRLAQDTKDTLEGRPPEPWAPRTTSVPPPETPEPALPPFGDPPDPSGERVEVLYDGPPMTPWTAAYVWAAAMTPPELTGDTGGDGDGLARALLARAITIAAREDGVLDGGPVPGPAVLATMSVPTVMLTRLEPPLKGMLEFTKDTLGYRPMPGEPGFQAYTRIDDMIRSYGLTPEDVLEHRGLIADLKRDGAIVMAAVTTARNATLRAVTRLTPADGEDLLFAQAGGWLNEFLRGWSAPDDDTQFRAGLEYILGWPGGNLPAGLPASTGTWYRLGLAPSIRRPARPAAWCRWLIDRGWAVSNGNGGCWLALPEEWAEPVRNLAGTMGCSSTLVQTWTAWTKGAETRPSPEFLRDHYGDR